MSNTLKQQAASAAIDYLLPRINTQTVLAIGHGSTVHCFIEKLSIHKHIFDGAVAASVQTAEQLKSLGIKVYELNAVPQPPFYIDGADEINHQLQMIKGGGGALTREKILATDSKEFICIATSDKLVTALGDFPIAIEVIPLARGLVARHLTAMGGSPKWRQSFISDNHNIILDVSNLDFNNPQLLEESINNITGVVCNGLFAIRHADQAFIAENGKTQQLSR